MLFTLIFFLHGGPGIWQFLLGAVPDERAHPRRRGRPPRAWPLWSATSGPPRLSPSSTPSPSASGSPCSVSRWPCRWPRWCSSARSSRSSVRWSPAVSRCSSRSSPTGPIAALIVLGIIIAIMQLEGHVLQPLLLGRAVKLHPLAVVLAIAAGLVVAGIAGALFAVPLLAVLNSGIRSLRSAADQHVDPDDVHTSAPAGDRPRRARPRPPARTDRRRGNAMTPLPPRPLRGSVQTTPAARPGRRPGTPGGSGESAPPAATPGRARRATPGRPPASPARRVYVESPSTTPQHFYLASAPERPPITIGYAAS